MTKSRSSKVEAELPFSKRGCGPAEEMPFYLPDFLACAATPYDPVERPDGLVNMGVAENKLVQDMLQERIERVQIKHGVKELGYADFTGTAGLKQAFARVLERWVFCGGKIEKPEERMIITNGCTSAIAMMATRVA